MKLNQDSITVNMVIKLHSDRYTIYQDKLETSIELIQKFISDGDFKAQFIPASFTTQSTGTLIIEES